MLKIRKGIVYLLTGFIFFQGSLTITGTAQESLFPSDVTNIETTAGENQITLDWDVATPANMEEGYITGYQIYYGTSSVQTANDEYEDQIQTSSTDNSYTIKGLKNNVTYYFAVTAIDDQGMESYNYSDEVFATPIEASTDFSDEDFYAVEPEVEPAGNLAVLSAKQSSETEITLEMSEDVFISEPEAYLKAFYVENKATEIKVEVVDVWLESNIVYLTFNEDDLIPGENYRAIASSLVVDVNGVPVSSGITDTVEFKADFEEVVDVPEPVAPAVISIEPVTEEKPAAPAVDLIAPAVDLIAPADVTNIKVDTSSLNAGRVTISWNASTSEDVADVIVYTQVDGVWDGGFSVGTVDILTTSVEINKSYLFKIVTKDTSDNVSGGVLTNMVSTDLAQSGPGMLVYLAVVIALVMFLAPMLARK